jgi:curved DNA-binding protein CbpA
VAKSEQSLYALLGVAPSATAEQIRAAYLKLVTEYHPDKHQDNPLKELARERLVLINQAYQTLSHSQRRAAYDAQQGYISAGPATGTRHSPTTAGGAAQRILITALVLLAIPLVLRFGLPILKIVFSLFKWVFAIL